MVQINFAQKQVNAKIVYYGPGMSGKTTNLEVVHQRAPVANRGDLTSISTDGDRTLFFDFMPLDLGTVAGMRTCFQLYTVPGQVYYNSTRKLVLQGVDGVVFVADSSAAMVEENLESMRNLEQNLAEYGKQLSQLPLIIQYNKRDLPDALPVEELNKLLNPWGVPTFEATANTGQGVFPTLKGLAARVLETIHSNSRPGGAPAAAAGLSQTGYHAAPSAPAARSLPQAPSQPAAPLPQQQPRAIPMQASPVGAGVQPLQNAAAQGHAPLSMQRPAPGGPQAPAHPDALARTSVHAPPQGIAPQGIAPQGFVPQQQSPGQPIGMQPPAMQPPTMAQQPMQRTLGMAPMQSSLGAPAHLHQTGMQRAPQMSSQTQGVAPRGPAAPMNAPGRAPVRPGGRADGAGQPAPARAAASRMAPGARSAGVEPGQRIQPRNQPMATPGGGKRRLMYTAVFVVVALGVGAVVAKMVLAVL